MRRLHIAAGCIGILGLFLGLCSLFGVVVSAGEAWREHVQKSWPQATAGIEHCRVEYRSSDGRPDMGWWLRCDISFRVGSGQINTGIYSGQHGSLQTNSTPDLMDRWVNNHPTGSTVVVRYDPAQPKTAILARDDMPYGGSRTPGNLRVVETFSIGCVSLLAIAMLLRRLGQPAQ